jgi:glycerol dehydrogenase
MLSVFCSPSRYTQGKNATATLGAEMAGLGLSGPALIVASRSPIRLLSGTWKRTFGETGTTYTIHDFGGECSLAEIERIKQVAKQHKSQVVVGAGGGKVLDAARAAAADLKLPVVTCPTVASSDAPCSALSVIYSDEGVVESSRFYRKNPDLVLVDTHRGDPLISFRGTDLLVYSSNTLCEPGCDCPRPCPSGQMRHQRPLMGE